jgi:serine/threonine protein phosphatase PrpC
MPQNLASNTFKNNNQQIPQKENNYNNEIINQNQNKMFPRYNQNNYNGNNNNYSDGFMDNQNQNQINPEYCYPEPGFPLKENELDIETNRMEKVNDEDENTQNKNDINNEENDENNKSNVNISYNDFDDSGWIKNYGGVTSPGKNEKGEQKTNQDALVSITNINNVRDFNIFGILDGHGPDGQKISEFASEYIPSQITKHPEIKSLTDPEEIYLKLKDNNCQIITDAYLSCDEQLKNAEFDAYNSGCTCILVIHIGNHIVCSNVGDSKGIVAYDEQVGQDEELNYLETAELSLVNRPEVLEERNRILMSGGIVEQMKNEYGQATGPYRVWARGKNFPGLALSRSIGDLLGKNIGVIPDPGILEYDLSESTKFIAICSDGVWVYLNDEIVKNYGKSFYLDNNASGFCHFIVNQSVSEWEKNGPNVDDISVVVIFF